MAPFERILVATDFSEPAARAVDAGVNLARRFGARLEVVHAVEAPIPMFEPYAVSLPVEIVEGVREAARQKLEALEQQLEADGLEVETVLLDVPAAAHIAARAETFGADLVVVGTRGLRAFKRALLGSTAERVVRETRRPVLTIKGGDGDEGDARDVTALPAALLVGTDFSEPAARAVRAAADLARALGARLYLAHAVDLELPLVGPYELSVPQGLVEEARRTAIDRLAAQARELAGEGGLDVEPHVLVGAPGQALCNAVSTLGADWLVVGTHGRSGLGRFLLGSVAERTLRQADCPVLTIPEAATGG